MSFSRLHVISFAFISLFLGEAHAKIDYLSLHEITSAVEEPLAVKMNIIEVQKSRPLQFVIEVQGEGVVLKYHRNNQFMLTLNHLEPLIGQGTIHAYEYFGKRWRKVKSVKLPILTKTLEATHIKPNNNKTKNTKNSVIEQDSDNGIVKEPLSNVTLSLDKRAKVSLNSCLISHDEKETLWSIASRHQSAWKTNVYGAMIAIYTTNTDKFRDKHIARLIKNSSLKCPSNGLLEALGTKEKMKGQYQELSQVK